LTPVAATLYFPTDGRKIAPRAPQDDANTGASRPVLHMESRRMGEPLAPLYDPKQVESRLYRWWEEKGFFHADADSEREPFTILMPPPNVTGELHIGHALFVTLQDLLIRWKRMQGYNALWIPGTDHAGIATQMIVERELRRREGLTRHDLGREAFLERVWAWKEQYGNRILEQIRVLGASPDWGRLFFTMDEPRSRAVVEVFVRLYEQGLIYRAHRLINWCPQDRTALSDLEVEHEENAPAELYSFAYPLADGSGEIVVATTRPETMLGDTAVAVHPDDERYRHLIGRAVRHPILGREIPVIADAELVDPAFGTGAVKITPAHDFNDFEVGRRHGLSSINILNPDGTLNEEAGPFAGLDRFEARSAVRQKLAELGLERGAKPHTLPLGRCQRCGTVVEPLLSLQWFVRIEPLARPAIEAVERGETVFVPENWTKTYMQWMENIHDWTISRQLWWGHRIPAWYGPDGEIFVARSEAEASAHARAHYGKEVPLEQDPDVLDTWFSSGLLPFTALGWPERTKDLERFYPTSVMETGYDIIFFWVARMMMMGLHFMGEVPFRTVFLHAMVRDEKGEKMSKTRGNVIDPLDVTAEYGADALRFALAAMAGQGRNINLSLGRVAGRWILSRLARTARDTTEALERFRFQDAAELIYGFIWGELADWYVELVKPRLYGEVGEASQAAARATLAESIDVALRLLHPFMPFVTEAVWQRLPRREREAEALMVAAWPAAREQWIDDTAEARMSELQELIGAVRNLRAEYGIQPGARIPVHVAAVPDPMRGTLDSSARALRDLARVERLVYGGADGRVGAHAVLRSGAEVFIPLEGVIDLDRERSRLRDELERVTGMLRSTETKLANETFVVRAPAEVVEREREKLQSYAEQRAKLEAKLRSLEATA
jgi:valyl-tRNA synthetase